MSTFDEFQKTEYEHVAEAHFKANEAISIFFRHYLLVMSLPLPVLGVLFGLIGRNENFEKVALSLLGVASPFFCCCRHRRLLHGRLHYQSENGRRSIRQGRQLNQKVFLRLL